jgi:hypothetical protein
MAKGEKDPEQREGGNQVVAQDNPALLASKAAPGLGRLFSSLIPI